MAVILGKAWFTKALIKAGAPANKGAASPGEFYSDYSKAYKASDGLLAQAVSLGENLEVAQIL